MRKVMIRPEPNDDYEIEDIYDDLDGVDWDEED
jgi:hypothetical protein